MLSGRLFSCRNKEILPLVTTWMDNIEDATLSEVSQGEEKNPMIPFHMQNKNTSVIEKEIRFVVTRDRRWGENWKTVIKSHKPQP